MKKPQNWDTTEAFTGDFKSITPGGHICKIKQAKVDTTQSGKEVLLIIFDIAEGEFKDYYAEQYAKRVAANPEAKWQGVYRQLTEGTSLPFFKGMITAIENSNPGFKFDFDETKLKGKLFGGVFGQEEYLNNNGETKLSTKCVFIRSVEQVRKGVEVPAVKKLRSDSVSSGFTDDDIPF